MACFGLRRTERGVTEGGYAWLTQTYRLRPDAQEQAPAPPPGFELAVLRGGWRVVAVWAEITYLKIPPR
jgi:hypothetical protein